MRKLNTHLFVAILISGIFLSSCSDSNSISSPDLSDEITSNESIEAKGKFSNLITQKEIDELLAKHAEELKKWESESHSATLYKALETSDFVLTELPTTYSGRVNAINNNGVAVGNDNGKSFIWKDGIQTILPSIYNSRDQALDINNNDVVVGHSRIPGGNFEGYVWSESAGLQRLGLPVSNSVYTYSLSTGEAINDNDLIAGYATFSSSGGYNGFANQVGDQLTNADISGSFQYSTLNDINENGDAIGRVYSQSTSWVAATWNATDGFSILNLPGINNPFLASINNAGDITGRGYNSNGNISFVQKSDGTLVELSANSQICPSSCFIDPYDINDAGVVVGQIRLPGGFFGTKMPFVWTEEEGITLLPTIVDSGFFIDNAALSINENGQIGGYSINSSYRTMPVIWSTDELGGPTNTAPIADAGADQTLEATGPQTLISLDGSASSDDDGDVLTYSWSLNGNVVATGESPTLNLSVATYTFTLTVSDGEESSTDDIIVEITDTTPPVITSIVVTNSIWPPNHKMTLAVSGVSATDIVDGYVETSIIVESSEPNNGKGDGNTDQDYEVISNPDGTLDVYVRSERSGKKNGRTYTITMSTIDNAGNKSYEIVEVIVDKNQAKKAK
ncbi:hypothetical protein GYB29_10500 [bacterium]|nr:hypothetical protein [Balneola sp.]MBR9918090.1 hypothetical protein [bacterium]